MPRLQTARLGPIALQSPTKFLAATPLFLLTYHGLDSGILKVGPREVIREP